jgi:hypothetical protein
MLELDHKYRRSEIPITDVAMKCGEFLIEKRYEIQKFGSALWYPKFVSQGADRNHEFRIPGTSDFSIH